MIGVLQLPQQLPLSACPIQIQSHNLYSMDYDYIQLGIFDCKTSVYVFLFIGNFYFLFVALDPFLLVFSVFMIEQRDTKLRSRINNWKSDNGWILRNYMQILHSNVLEGR